MRQNTAAILLGALVLSIGPGVPVSACINEYREVERPSRRERPSEYISKLRDHSEHDRVVAGPAPADPGPAAGYKARTDYAAVLIRRGEAKKAVEILERVEREKPGEYIVAANLGTAYELSGDLAKARHWIGKGIERNPRAHEGTEWLHLRILEARSALAKDPSWLKSHSVLGMDFGKEGTPRMPGTLPEGAGKVDDVIDALTYQLHERMAFVKAPDPLVGGMLSDLADLLSMHRSIDLAVPVYALALSYRPLQAALVEERMEALEGMIAARHRADPTVAYLFGGLALVMLLGAGALVLLRKENAPGTAHRFFIQRRLRRS